MGKKEKTIRKVVLDTNILVSALLFRGDIAKIVDLWKDGRIIPVVSKETFEEFRQVLQYPKFKLTNEEITTIIEEECLPFFEVAEVNEEIKGVCNDPDDNKFISCVVSAGAEFIVSGDKQLCNLNKYRKVRMINASDFLAMYF